MKRLFAFSYLATILITSTAFAFELPTSQPVKGTKGGGLLLIVPAALDAGPGAPFTILKQVPADRRAEVAEIVADPTFVRTLEFKAAADPRVFTYLLDHPDVNAALARALGIASYRVVRIGPGRYQGEDGGGNVGTIEVFATEGTQQAVLERGVSSGWWFGDLAGRVVVLIAVVPAGDRVRGRVTVWARIDQGMVDRLLRLLKPMLSGFLDRKLREQLAIPFRVAEDAARDADQFCFQFAALPGESRTEGQALSGLAGCDRRIGVERTSVLQTAEEGGVQ
jgi:hypothetical protein